VRKDVIFCTSRLPRFTVTYKIDTVYRLVFTELARHQYDELAPRLARQVDKALGRLQANPQTGKPLRGELHGIWSERVSSFRILYKINRPTIEVLILVIEHRKLVYGGH